MVIIVCDFECVFFYFLDVFEDISKNLELDVNGKLDGKLMADDGGCYVN